MVLVVDVENSIIIIIKLESTPSEGLPLNYLVLMNRHQIQIWYQFIQIRLLSKYCDLLYRTQNDTYIVYNFNTSDKLIRCLKLLMLMKAM